MYTEISRYKASGGYRGGRGSCLSFSRIKNQQLVFMQNKMYIEHNKNVSLGDKFKSVAIVTADRNIYKKAHESICTSLKPLCSDVCVTSSRGRRRCLCPHGFVLRYGYLCIKAICVSELVTIHTNAHVDLAEFSHKTMRRVQGLFLLCCPKAYRPQILANFNVPLPKSDTVLREDIKTLKNEISETFLNNVSKKLDLTKKQKPEYRTPIDKV
ncbi:hypothetical protein HELRODRAFT_165059 [Helobdella robusta]|uniref:EGF-like domain-containing protein n=1 Tax=Helobdella robusta TaxID=6412 RepID=T1EW81_HELRO|nr:hypothetical protein HELRODRAFT_165059 [Helobdella robusta]ESN92923.1 hypothetical protein HELRODRAFT_165059 [Helobdella robusta]